MRNLINRWERPSETQVMVPRFSRMQLTPTFVETGDERCPIAGIWSRPESDATADDSELAWPAVGRLLLGGPFHPGLTPPHYSNPL